MRKFILSAAAAASLFALPAFAADRLSSDAEIRADQEWQLVIAKANADRLGQQQAVIASGAPEHAAVPTTLSNRLSSDAEVRWQQEWERLVAKTKADRDGLQAVGDIAATR